jgi:putative ABC transport system permease protein
MPSLGQDFRYGARLLWKAPGFTAVALAALALGIGATTAIFSVVDAALLKPLPFPDPGSLVALWENNPAAGPDSSFVAPANFREWQRQSQAFKALAAIRDSRLNLNGGPDGYLEPEELHVERVTAGLFPLLGVSPVLGRAFREEEDRPGRADFALLSQRLWTRRFGADRSIPGKSIRLGDRSYTVLGVLPAGFSVLNAGVDVWVPLALATDDARGAGFRYLQVIGRLRPGAGLNRARTEMETIAARLEQSNPALDKGWRPLLVPLREELAGHVERALFTLLAAVLLLLLMACANVASLLLARGAARRKEIAIRVAMGASRARVTVQLLAESILLALVGGALGTALAWAAVRLLARFGPDNIPRLAQATVDPRLLLFALSVSTAAGILFGLAPAVQASQTNGNAALSEGGRGGTAGRAGRRMRHGLVVFEMALAVIVLIGAGLLMRSFARLRVADPGFQPSGLLTFRLPLAGGRNAAPDRRIVFFQELERRIAALPGVRGVGAVNALPLSGLSVGAAFAEAGAAVPPPDQRPVALMRSASPSYFRAMGIPLIAGREFLASDVPGAAPVVVVNRRLAGRFWPRRDPIGARLAMDAIPGRVAEIVGVVGDVKPERLEGEDWPTIYSPYPQAAAVTMIVVVRTAQPPSSLASAVRREVRQLDPEQPVADLLPMEDVLGRAVAGPRFNAALLGIFAWIAFTLAAVGIYGVISYDVSRRTNEIGIRAALGAGPPDILRLILGQGARLAAYGIGLGLAAAFALTRLIANLLYGIDPADAWTFAGIALLLGAVALAASYLPSRRAMALDPVAALRHE